MWGRENKISVLRCLLLIWSSPLHDALLLFQADSGLDFLLPLYSFLQNTCQEAVYCFLITEFREAQYVKENIDKHVKRDMTLFKFFCHINQIVKDVKGGRKNSKNKPKRSPSSSQASCSKQQHCSLSHPQQKHQIHSPVCGSGGQQHPAHLNQYINQPQEMAKDQHAAQCMEDLQSTRPSEILNLHEKEKILDKITVNNLLQKDKDTCRLLQELDLNFVLNIILNKLINFRLIEKGCVMPCASLDHLVTTGGQPNISQSSTSH